MRPSAEPSFAGMDTRTEAEFERALARGVIPGDQASPQCAQNSVPVSFASVPVHGSDRRLGRLISAQACEAKHSLRLPTLQIALLLARKYRDVDGDGVADREMLTIMLQCDSSSHSAEELARLRRLAHGGVEPGDL